MKKSVILLLFLMLFLAPVAFVVTAMEPEPIVTKQSVAGPADAARTKEIARRFRALTESSGDSSIRLTQADMNSILASGTRAVSLLRSQAIVTPDTLSLRLSVDARRIPGGGWLNLKTAIGASDAGLNISSVKFGPFSLPESLVLPVLGYVVDWTLGDGLGSVAIKAIDGVAIDGQQVVLGIGLNAADRKALSQRAKQKLRSAANISSPEQVRFYFRALEKAVRDGKINPRGSVVQYLRFALEKAREKAAQGTGTDEVKAALLALATYCGHPKFADLIGDVIPEQQTGRQSGCSSASLQGRGDLRQHFAVSAGLKAAGDTGIAFAIGELKELLDSNKGGSGFSFDDLTSDRAGIKFAEVFLGASPELQGGLLKLLVSEEAILPRTDDLPSGLSEADFKRRFGNVDSAAYKAIVREIDKRISSLPIYAVQ